MFRMALEFVQPDMELGRDIYGTDGRIMLAAGATITEKHIKTLKKWDILSVYIKNPVTNIPPIDEVVAESVRIKASNTMRASFDKIAKDGLFELTGEQLGLVKTIIQEVLRKRLTIIHLAQIHRHHDDLFSHSINVAILSTMTAVAFGISNSTDLRNITIGSLLHDIGSVFIPKHILNKPTPLTDEEQTIFEGHTVLGFELLRKSKDIPLVAAHIALQHHENHNGHGYPRKLSGTSIIQFARIVRIADEYDQLVADRQGGKSISPHLAYEIIVAGVNSKFDPAVAKAFLSKIALYPVGTMVKLTTGDVGVVTAVIPNLQHRPTIQVIADSGNKLLPNPFTLNLADKENLTIFIEEVISDAAAVDFFKKNLLKNHHPASDNH